MAKLQQLLDRDELQRVLYSIIRSVICDSRNIGLQEFMWPGHSSSHEFGDQGLDLDSLERMDVASRIMAFFELHETDIGDRLLIAQSLEQSLDLVWRFSDSPNLCFQTSGSTGAPREARHALSELVAEARGFAGQVTAQRVVSLVPSHHIYGFIWSVLLPKALNATVLENAQARQSAHGQLRRGDMLIAAPVWWRYLADNHIRIADGVIGISSTAPMDEKSWHKLCELGLHKLYEVYGASELGGIGYRTHWQSPFTLLDHWQRAPGQPEQLVRCKSSAPITPPDHLNFVDEREFVILGRTDHQVQVAGMNVSPSAVARKIEQLEIVSQCQVRLMTPNEGYRLKAQLVTKYAVGPEERQHIQNWCRTHLSVPERPHLTFVHRLSENAMGKAKDWAIAQRALDS